MIMHDIHDKSSLISKLFKTYPIPKEPFDPKGNWEHKYLGIDTYSIISVPKILRKRSELKIERKNLAGGMYNLIINSERECRSQFLFFTDANLKCRNDEISTPESWYYESKVAKERSDTPYLKSGLKKEFDMKNDKLHIKTNGIDSYMNFSGAYTCKWCLFDSVQHMHKEAEKPLNFSMFDEYDALIGEQTFRFRESAKIETTDGLKEVSCFELLGVGTTPSTYWVDDSGRLLFYISGMELAVLTEENGKEIIQLSTFKQWDNSSNMIPLSE